MNMWSVYSWAKKNMPIANLENAVKVFPSLPVEEVAEGLEEYYAIPEEDKQIHYEAHLHANALALEFREWCIERNLPIAKGSGMRNYLEFLKEKNKGLFE